MTGVLQIQHNIRFAKTPDPAGPPSLLTPHDPQKMEKKRRKIEVIQTPFNQSYFEANNR